MDTTEPADFPLTTALGLIPDWELAMRAESKSPHTIRVYTLALRQYFAWTRQTDRRPLDLNTLNQWIADTLATGKSGATARTRQLAVRRFTRWLQFTGRLTADPFLGIRTPKVETPLVHPLTDDELRALLRTCQTDADDAVPDDVLRHRRDEAIIRLMLETAIRKGGKPRIVPIGPHAISALVCYLDLRQQHRLASTPALWLGTRSRAFSHDGLRRALGRRAEQAGIDGFHPHRLRHTDAHRWLAKGGSEAGLMAIAGWSRTDMLIRYTRARASERAADESRRLDLGAL